MTSRAITNPDQLPPLYALLGNLNLPITVSWVQGKDRSGAQNNLAFKWYAEIAQQLGDREAWEVRAHCKYYHGVKMLVTENDDFRRKWQSMLMPLPLETKLALMVEPFDMPVTRQMKVSQMSRYLESIISEFSPMGVVLTMPEEKL